MPKTATIFLALVLLSGCLQAEGASALPQIPPDNSLEPGAYIAEGLPAHDRTWNAQDYSQAAAVLRKLAEADITNLPRANSARSGAVFARIVSPDNLSLAATPELSQQQQLSSLVELLQGVNQISSVYLAASQKRGVFDSEMVDLARYVLEVVARFITIVEEIFPAMPAEDPGAEARLKGREKMRQGVATIVSGVLTTLTEHSSYRTAELLRLSATLENTLPRIYRFLPAGVQQELPIRLTSMVSAESDPALKDSLARLADLAKSAAGSREETPVPSERGQSPGAGAR